MKTRRYLCIISFAIAIVIGIVALFMPPAGIIDSSVLWFTAQLLVFTSGLLGIDITIDPKNRFFQAKQMKED